MNQSVQRNVIRVLNVAQLRYDYNLSFTAGRPVFLEVGLMWSLLVVLNVPPFQIWPTSLGHALGSIFGPKLWSLVTLVFPQSPSQLFF